MVHNFKSMQAVPTAKDFIDIVLSKTQRGTPTVVHNGAPRLVLRRLWERAAGCRCGPGWLLVWLLLLLLGCSGGRGLQARACAPLLASRTAACPPHPSAHLLTGPPRSLNGPPHALRLALWPASLPLQAGPSSASASSTCARSSSRSRTGTTS